MSERWRIEPEYAIKVKPELGILGVLQEPTTVVTKAWQQILAVGQRSFWEPKTVLVTGAGPIGLLGALIGKQLGFEVHVLDRNQTGLKPELVGALGATYHSSSIAEVGFAPDVIMECTGVGAVITDAISVVAANGIICLTGVGHGGAVPKIATANVATSAVLKNIVIFGSVNANKRHWYKAGEILARSNRDWLSRLITRSERLEDYAKALERQPGDIKVVLQLSEI
jgi:threonine dehydrogenase-like Zn-dependent dehydrogenase